MDGAGADDFAHEHKAGAFRAATDVAPRREPQAAEGEGLALALSPFHQRHGQVRIGAMGQQLSRDACQNAGAHVERQGGRAPGKALPVRRGILQQVVALQHAKLPRHAAVSERNTRGRSGPEDGTHPRDELEGDACLGEGLGLFSTPPVEERIAALESDNTFAGKGVSDQQFVDDLLGRGRFPAALSHGNHDRPSGIERLETRLQQGIRKDDFRRLQGTKRPHRQEIWCSGSGPHQGDEAVRRF